MVDVIVETDTTYMDRVRSRVASLPGYPLEELLPRIERTKDVEPLAALFDPDRRVDFRESLLETGLDIDDELAEKLPLWSDRFMALRIDTDGSAAASDVLDIAVEFARYVAYEIGLASGRALLTDCVAGSVTFKLPLGLDRINITNAVAAALIFWAIQSCTQAIVEPKEHPQLIDFHTCAAERMKKGGIKRLTFYTDDGVMVSCDREQVIETAERIPQADYSSQDARPPRIDYRELNKSYRLQATFDEEIPPRMQVVEPKDAARQMGTVNVSMTAELRTSIKPEILYRIEGFWRNLDRKRHVFVVRSAEPKPQDPPPPDHEQAELWLEALRRTLRPGSSSAGTSMTND